jgi:hypothetical protein
MGERVARLKEKLLHLYYSSIEALDSESLQHAYYPYFSAEQRQTYFLVPPSILEALVQPGDCIHFPFLAIEQKICLDHLKQRGISIKDIVAHQEADVLAELESIMLGRHASDIFHWFQDFNAGRIDLWHGDKLILFVKQHQETIQSHLTSPRLTLFNMLETARFSNSSLADLVGPTSIFDFRYEKVTHARMNSGPFTCIKPLR